MGLGDWLAGKNREVLTGRNRGNFLKEIEVAGVTSEQLNPKGFASLGEEQKYAVDRAARGTLDSGEQQRLAGQIGYRPPVQQTDAGELGYMKGATQALNRMIGSRGGDRVTYSTVDSDGNPLSAEEVEAMVKYEKRLNRELFITGKRGFLLDFHGLDIREDVGLGERKKLEAEAARIAEEVAGNNFLGAEAFRKVHGRNF